MGSFRQSAGFRQYSAPLRGRNCARRSYPPHCANDRLFAMFLSARLHYLWLKAILLVVSLLAPCAFAASQQSNTTRVDGRITNEGKSVVGARVVLSHQETFEVYHGTTDKYGTFSISDVPRGSYLVSILNAADDVLFRKVLSLNSASDAPIRLDLELSGKPTSPNAGSVTPSGSEPGNAGSPAPASARDGQVNALERRYETAMRAGDQQEEVAALKALVAADPTRWDYFEALGDAQSNLGDYEAAAVSYDKGVQAAQDFLSSPRSHEPGVFQAERDRVKIGISQMLIGQGNALLKAKKNAEAIAAYKKGAELGVNPATAYFNLCVAHYNTRILEGSEDACDKAIAADPQKAEAYFIKGALLLLSAKPDKAGKLVAPAGTIEALKKYLELAPQGPQAASARQMLDYLGANDTTPGKSRKP